VSIKANHTHSNIADLLSVHKSTISRELRHNSGLRGYPLSQAHRRCLERRDKKARPRIKPSTWLLVERLLREQWSPEQISGWLQCEHDIGISVEWIYHYTLEDKQSGGTLYKPLRCQKQRKKRYGIYSYRGQIPHQVSIEQRPSIVDKRSRYGDWELDTVIGKHHQQALVTLVERKSKLTFMAKVVRKTAENVSHAIVGLLWAIKPWVHTLTSDKGREFARHVFIAKTLNAQFYFAHPYASWERGLNENTNGLIRPRALGVQYFPKGREFKTITIKEINTVMDKLNNRPRKCLGIKTPNQVLLGINPNVALVT